MDAPNDLPRPPGDLPEVGSFWFGSDLSWLEQLCLTSFLDRGHRVTLYAPAGTGGIPAGVRHADPAEILWPPPFDIGGNDRLGVAVFSDIFRLELLAARRVIWVDADAYCVKPFDFPSPFVFTVAPNGNHPIGVLALPQDSEVLAQMRDFVRAPNPTQPWRGAKLRRMNAARIAKGERWGIQHLSWGCSGPKALRHFMGRSAEARHALPYPALYGLDVAELWKLHAPGIAPEAIERPGIYSIHIYGHQKKALALAHGGLPVPGSYLEALCHRHGVRPEAAPIPSLRWMTKDAAAEGAAASGEAG